MAQLRTTVPDTTLLSAQFLRRCNRSKISSLILRRYVVVGLKVPVRLSTGLRLIRFNAYVVGLQLYHFCGYI